MKQKQRVALLCMAVVALIFAACDGDSGNNGTETEEERVFSFGKSSSSSAVVVDPSTVVSGTMTDSRDNQVYKTVTIGVQTWMAENLNYAVDSSWCYENSADSCAKYGRLYQWASAMWLSAAYNSTRASSVISVPHQGVCPAGWHIPTDEEWMTLVTAVGGEDVAGTALKSRSGWYEDVYVEDGYGSGNGTDAYGFSALPAGYRYYDNGAFILASSSAYFWSATECWVDKVYTLFLMFSHTDANILDKPDAISVRCVKDAE